MHQVPLGNPITDFSATGQKGLEQLLFKRSMSATHASHVCIFKFSKSYIFKNKTKKKVKSF